MCKEKSESEVKSLTRVRLFATPWIVSLPGSSTHGIFQARVLEWVAISFSRGSSQTRDQTQVSCIEGRCFTLWATREERNVSKKQNWLRYPSRESHNIEGKTDIYIDLITH